MKKITLLFAVVIALTTCLIAQNTNKEIEAVAKSYEEEQYGEYEKAVATILTVYDPQSYVLNLRLGWLTYLDGDYTKSMNYYKKAIEIAPNSIEARLGYVYPAAELENWEDVIAKYKEILKLDPANSLANYRLGLIYYNRKEFNQAHDYTRKVVALYPFDYDSVILLAWIKLSIGEVSEAKALFHRALLYDSNATSALEGLEKIK